MQNAINEYIIAKNVLLKKEEKLNRLVEAQILTLIATENIDELHALIDTLPTGYKGIRRIYQAIEELT